MNQASAAEAAGRGRLATFNLFRPGAWRRSAGAAPYLLLAPALLVLAGVLLYPMAMLVELSFQHYGLRQLIAHAGEFVGLDNYREVLGDRFFWTVVLRTVAFAAVNVALTMLIGTLIALLLEKVHRPVRVLLTAGLVLVWATPVVVAVDLWQWMFDFEFGVVNWLLTHLGAGNYLHHNWFANPLQGFAVITVVVVWGALPFVVITLSAGLSQVPRDMIEAAEVDGAGGWAIFWHVVAPVLRPVFIILATLSTIWDFKVFDQVWVMLNQRPARDYFLLGIYSFSESFRVTQYGLGATLAVVMVLILAIATSGYVRHYMGRLGEEAG
jgi:N,N'-diacetylchitobiose transport system permease protein